jgi:DNA-binding LytR/AlgR family response regulator
MKKFYVELVYTGVLKVEVEAESKDEVLEKIYNADREKIIDGKVDDIDWIESEEDYHEKIVQGDRFFGIQNESYFEELEDEE